MTEILPSSVFLSLNLFAVYNMPFESNTEAGIISVLRGSRQVLVKVVLF